jgi:hypothetical protein
MGKNFIIDFKSPDKTITDSSIKVFPKKSLAMRTLFVFIMNTETFHQALKMTQYHKLHTNVILLLYPIWF